MAKIGGLGRGLDALFDQNAVGEHAPAELRVSDIEPNRSQPRQDFDEQALLELAESIKTHGVLQPLVVRPKPDSPGTYQIVAGERRWRASRMAGISTVPVVIRELSDLEAAQVALIENLQREDLNPVEEALGLRSLMEQYGMTQEQVAQRVGKSRPAVANALRILALPPDILNLVREGKITSGHARALLSFSDEEQLRNAVRLSQLGASVREIERMAKKKPAVVQTQPAEKQPSYYAEVELALCSELGRKVRVTGGKDRGTLEIEFYSPEDLFDLANHLGRQN